VAGNSYGNDLRHSLVKLCTKNYEILSIFVKITAKKISGTFLCGHGVVFRCNLCLYLVPFLRYSALNNGMTLKSGFGVVQGH